MSKLVRETIEVTCGTLEPAGSGALVVTVEGATVTEGLFTLLELFVVVVPAEVPGGPVVITLGRIACSQEGGHPCECSIKLPKQARCRSCQYSDRPGLQKMNHAMQPRCTAGTCGSRRWRLAQVHSKLRHPECECAGSVQGRACLQAQHTQQDAHPSRGWGRCNSDRVY